MSRDTLYPQQGFIDLETLGAAEAVKVEEFVQPFSEPLRLLQGVAFATVLAVSSGMAPIDPETLGDPGGVVDESTEWVQPFSQPIFEAPGNRFAAALAAGFAPIDPETLNDPETDRLEWFTAFSQPVLVPRGDAYTAALASGAVPTDPETLNDQETDRLEWYAPFSERVPERLGNAYAATLAAGMAPIDPETLNDGLPADTGTAWYAPFSEPILQPAGINYAATLSAGPAPIDPETLNDPLEDKLEWYAAFAEPVRPKVIYQHPAAFDDHGTLGDAGVPADTSVEDWWAGFSEPILQLPGLAYFATLAASGMAPIDPEGLGAAATVFVADSRIFTPGTSDRTFDVASGNRTFTPADN